MLNAIARETTGQSCRPASHATWSMFAPTSYIQSDLQQNDSCKILLQVSDRITASTHSAVPAPSQLTGQLFRGRQRGKTLPFLVSESITI